MHVGLAVPIRFIADEAFHNDVLAWLGYLVLAALVDAVILRRFVDTPDAELVQGPEQL